MLHWLACPPELGTVYRVFLGSPYDLQDFLMRVIGLDAKYVTVRDIRCSADSVNVTQHTLVFHHAEWQSHVQRGLILRQSWLDLI